MRVICCLLLWTLGINQAYALGISLVVSQPQYTYFATNSYGYSSLFQQGRDYFHWLDVTYADYDYALAHERGRAESWGTSYRLSKRLRLSRRVKPFLFSGVSILQITKQNRIKVNADHSLLGQLDNTIDNHQLIFVGSGYLWERKDFIIGFSVDYGYDNGYESDFWSPVFLFSWLL